jgi:hypothetical protein
MRTGEVEANLLKLNETAKLSYVDELVARKLAGVEKSGLDVVDVDFHEREYHRLVAALEDASLHSELPVDALGYRDLSSFLVRIRFEQRNRMDQA